MSNWERAVPNETVVQLLRPYIPKFDKEPESRGNYAGGFADDRDLKTGKPEAIFVLKFSLTGRDFVRTC